MNFFNPFKKEKRSETPPQVPFTKQLEEKSYCDMVQKQQSFLDFLKQLTTYDPMSISPVFCAVNLISNSLAQMPWDLKTKDGDIINPSFLNHLTDDTNTTHFTLVKNMIKDMLLSGDGFAYIIRDKAGKPLALKYLPHGTVSIDYNQITDSLYYLVPTMKNGRVEPINIIHFVMHSRDGVQGRSVIDFARNTIENAGYTEKASKDYFQNGMSVQGIIKSPQRLQEDRRSEIRKGWNATPDSIRILEGGLEYQQVQSTSKEAELTQNRLFNVTEVARFFNISPILLGDLTHTQYASIEMAQQEFVTNTLAPYVQMMEQELNKKFILSQEKELFYIDINEEVLIKTDKKSHVETISSLVDKGIITRNEGRKALGFAPIDDEFANSLVLTYKTTEEEKEKDTDKTDEN